MASRGHGEHAADHRGYIGPGLWIRLGVLVLVVGSYLATVIVNVHGERRLIEADIERISNVTTISAQKHTETIFEATAQTLGALRSDLMIAPHERKPQFILDDHFFAPPYLLTTLLIDENYLIVASNFRDVIGNRADPLPFFEVHRTSSPDLVYTGDIIVGNVTGAPHFFSSLGLRKDGGKFSGVIAAAYELTYLRDLYAQLVPGENYTIALFEKRDGLIVASDSNITRGELPKSSQFTTNAIRGVDGEPGRLEILLDDGREALTTSKLVGSGPFFVVTLADVHGLLAKHRSDSMIKYALAALFVLTAVMLATALEVYIVNRRNAQAEKAILEEELRHSQKMEALGTLAGGLAHEFNNLLSSIIGFGEMAKERATGQDRLVRSIDHILLAGRRAETIVNQILAFSRRAGTEQKSFRIDRIVHEAMELMGVSIPPSIDTSVVLDNPDVQMMGDPGQIHQVVMNLCNNAVQAMPHGGRLDVRIARVNVVSGAARQSPELEPGSYVKLSVSDNGHGIEPAAMGRIFDPFFTTKERGKGTGLGLSIVHGIVTAHGGIISVDSTPGKGTTIDVYFSASAQEPDDELPDVALALDGASRTVMFVDDDAAIVSLLEERLENMGFRQRGFCTPMEALAAFRAEPNSVDLLITDLSMPGMTGLELAEAFRALRTDLPIVLMTGYGAPDIADQAARHGITEILKKPLRARRIAQAIANVLGAKNGSRDAKR